MFGTLEAIRKDGTAVKIDGKWIELEEGAQKFAKYIPPTSPVEYSEDGSFIKKAEVEKKVDADRISADNYAEIMQECAMDALKIFADLCPEEWLEQKINLSSHINSLFIARTRRNNGR